MLSRRTRAVLELVGAASGLIVLVCFRWVANRHRHIDRAARIEAVTQRRTEESSSTMAADHTAGATTDDVKAVFGAGLAEAGMAAPLKPRWIIIGVAEALTWRLLSDYDVWQLRHSRRRRFVAGLLQYPLHRLSTQEDATWSFGIGQFVGILIYRLKYGVLNDPPDA
jgi:hypothetical protein